MGLLKKIPCALLTVTENVGHFEAFKKKDQYIVWAEDGQGDAVWADNMMQQQTITGTIDYFTKIENDENMERIQEALNDAEICFKLNSVQYEGETGYIHYEWVWEIE